MHKMDPAASGGRKQIKKEFRLDAAHVVVPRSSEQSCV